MPNNSMNFGVDLLPVTTDIYNLGSDEKKWKIHGTIPLSGVTDADDLKIIEGLSGTGLLKRTGNNTWTLDSTSYTTNTGTVTKVSTGAGLTGGDITTTGTVKANLTSETKLTNAAADDTETAGRVYPVRLDKDGKLAVNVPWVNTNNQYAYGNISTSGTIDQTSGWALANGDGLIVFDSSNSNKLERTAITFDASTETKCLTQAGTWAQFNNYIHPTDAGNKHIPSGGSSGQYLVYNSSGTATWGSLPSANDTTAGIMKLGASGGAATYEHTHAVSIASDSGTTNVTSLSVNTTYKLTAGGSNMLFKTPASVTSIKIQTTSPLSGGNATPITSSGEYTLSLSDGYGDTKNPYGNKDPNLVLAGPASGVASAPSFRALVSADLPKATTSSIGAISVSTGLSINNGELSVSYGTTAGTASEGNHTHTCSIASAPDATNQITLNYGTKYQLTAGGQDYVFTMPSLGTTSSTAAAGDHNHDSEYFKLTGGTVTGGITRRIDVIQTSQANNLSNDYSGFYLADKDGFKFARYIGGTSSSDANGYETYVQMTVRGKDSSGNDQTYRGIAIYMDKSSTVRYVVASPAAFRSAIGAGTSSLAIGTTSTTAAAGNHTHTCKIATDSGTNQVTLAYGTKYKLTAGGATYIFTTPSLGTTSTTAAAGNHNHDSAYFPLSGGMADGSIYFKSTSLVKGTAPSSTTSTAGLGFFDKNGTGAAAHRLGTVATYVTSASTVITRLYAYKYNTSDTTNAYWGPGYSLDEGARTFGNVKIYGAVWNDYAEYRKGNTTSGGYCVTETSSGSLVKTTNRLQPGCRITSDTFGFAIGKTKECRTPIAVSGRVLVYTYRPREEYELGAAVCSAPNGTIDIMTREEIREYPDRIVGIVSEIPDYEIWHCGGDGEDEETNNAEIPVNNRIWIYVR